MNSHEYAKELAGVIDGDRYASLIKTLGDELNDRKDRFDKSDIIEQSLEIYSGGRLKWVDDIGRDNHDIVRGFDLEFKYHSNVLFTEKRKEKRKVIKIKLKNSLGKHKGTTVNNPADFYLFGQEDSIALISWTDIKPYLVAVSDGIESHVPHDKLSFIFLPEEVTVSMTSTINYKQVKSEAQRKLIESIQ